MNSTAPRQQQYRQPGYLQAQQYPELPSIAYPSEKIPSYDHDQQNSKYTYYPLSPTPKTHSNEKVPDLTQQTPRGVPASTQEKSPAISPLPPTIISPATVSPQQTPQSSTTSLASTQLTRQSSTTSFAPSTVSTQLTSQWSASSPTLSSVSTPPEEKSPSTTPLPPPTIIEPTTDEDEIPFGVVFQPAESQSYFGSISQPDLGDITPQQLAPPPVSQSYFGSISEPDLSDTAPQQLAPQPSYFGSISQPDLSDDTASQQLVQPPVSQSYFGSISQPDLSDTASQQLVPPPSYVSPGTAPIIPSNVNSGVQPIVEQSYESQTLAPEPIVVLPATPKPKDDKKTGSTVRFLGDTLVGRFARSALHTTSSTVRIVSYLSPWGDNNSLTLPNIRYRDAVLFGTFAVIGTPLLETTGDLVSSAVSDTFAAAVVDPVTNFFVYDPVAKYALFQVIEQAIDRAVLDHLFPEKEKMLKTTSIKSIQAVVKHKLMDVTAEIQFFRPTDSVNSTSIEKGWFCPYLYASNRTPKIAREIDFGIAQVHAPFLQGDHKLAEKLLVENSSVMALCDPDPTHDIGSRRLLVTVIGIRPFRAGMWSSSRRPGASLMYYHLLDGCPSLVIPVKESCPINAWSPITLKTMTSDNYNPDSHHEILCEFLDREVNKSVLSPKMASKFDEVLSQCVSMVINGAVGLKKPDVPSKVKKSIPWERAGIAFFRY